MHERTIKYANYNRTLNGVWQFDRRESPDRIMKVEQNDELTVNVNKREVTLKIENHKEEDEEGGDTYGNRQVSSATDASFER